MVKFVEETHQYFDTVTNEEYTSVTTFIHLFEKPFDEVAQATRISRRTGEPVESILNKWHETSRRACDYGTAIHLAMENYITKNERQKGLDGLYNSFDAIMDADISKASAIHSELLLWNDDAKLAGTADLILDIGEDEFLVGDFKTNRELSYFSKYREHMLFPLLHLGKCNYNTYSLQLSIYAYFYSKMTGRKCRNIFLLYKDGDVWTKIPANYMAHEVIAVLQYYKQHPELAERAREERAKKSAEQR